MTTEWPSTLTSRHPDASNVQAASILRESEAALLAANPAVRFSPSAPFHAFTPLPIPLDPHMARVFAGLAEQLMRSFARVKGLLHHWPSLPLGSQTVGSRNRRSSTPNRTIHAWPVSQ